MLPKKISYYAIISSAAFRKNNDSVEQFHAKLAASGADCEHREVEFVQDMFTAHMLNEKIFEELLAETRTHKEAYEYAIRCEKGIEPNRTIKSQYQVYSHASGNIIIK